MSINKIRINFVRRVMPRRGPFSTEEYNASMEEASVDLTNIANRWNEEAFPILDSLPKGDTDAALGGRWVGGTEIPDPVVDGLDGNTIFIDNTETISDDYYDEVHSRPKTIKECIDDASARIEEVYTELGDAIDGFSNGLTAAQWEALDGSVEGNPGWVQNGGSGGPITPAGDNLIHSINLAQTGVNNLNADVYDTTTPGTLTLTLEEMITALLEEHEGAWNTDVTLSHASISITQGQVDNSSSSPKGRGAPSPTDLEDDMNRLRYEIAQVKGVTWETDPQWNSAATSLQAHVDLLGNGSIGASNPHAMARQDVTGVDTEFGYIQSFIGKADGNDTTSFSSENYIANADSLETAMGKLDTAVYANRRREESFSAHTDPTAGITVTHNSGTTFPLVQVVDTGAGVGSGVLADEVYKYEQELGLTTTDAFVEIVYNDGNSFTVYTNITNGMIIYVC